MTSRMKLYSDPLESEDTALTAKAKAFARDHILPNAEEWQRSGQAPREAFQLASADFGGLIVPQSMGGKGVSLVTFLRVVEELARVDIAFALAFIVHGNVAFVVSQSENEDLRKALLPDLINSDKIGAFCLTEPQAGSDATSLQTTAAKDGSTYLINGEKAWVTNASHADVLAVFARSSEDRGARGIACFALSAGREGISRSDPYDLVSGAAVQTGGITFTNCPAAAHEILFEAGSGFGAAMGALDAARLGVAAMCNGALAGALDYGLDYARNRKMFGGTAFDQQGLQWAFADHLSELEASRTLMFQAAARFQAGKGTSALSAHAKKFANKSAAAGMSWAMRAMGAAGTDRRHPLARQFSSAQLLFNTDGTPEVMNVIIGRELARG